MFSQFIIIGVWNSQYFNSFSLSANKNNEKEEEEVVVAVVKISNANRLSHNFSK